MRSRVWSTRSRVLAVAGSALLVAGLVWLTWWLLGNTTSGDGAGVANVLALPATVLGTALAAAGLRSRPRADDPAVLATHAGRLLTAVATSEARTLAQLLGDTGDPRPADVGFEAAALRWRSDGGGQAGSLATIAAYYAGLDRGRLVILGEAGAGKTVLALRLLLDLATAARAAADADPGTQVRVPVRLSLPAFTTEVTHPAGVRERIDSWIAGQLAEVHGVPQAIARVLVGDGWVLPVLDGLDEMDADRSGPGRAGQVLAALNLATGPAPGPVVLTCRTARYEHLATGEAAHEALQDATAVTLQPLGVDEVVTWLAHRFPDPAQPDGLQKRWRPVVTTLRDHPGGRLARCLTSPLRLYLAVTVYRRPDTRPRVLCDLDRPSLDRHLLTELVPAVTAHHPRPDHGHHVPDDVERWLRTLADHLAEMAARGHSGIDLHLHELWRTTGHPPGVRIRRTAALIATALVALPMAVIGVLYAMGTGTWIPDSRSETIPVAAALVTLVLLFQANSAPTLDPPKRIDLRRIRTPRGRRALVHHVVLLGFSFGLVGGLVGMLMQEFVSIAGYGAAGGVAFGAALGLTAAPVVGLEVDQRTATRPSDPLRQALVRSVLIGVPAGITTGIMAGSVITPVHGLLVGVMVGLLIGLGSEWLPRYLLTIRALSRSGDLPAGLGRFLDWAYGAGLVRLAGTATQFRHRDLQEHLTTRTAP